MSQYFRAGDLSLWNPSNRVADLFVRTGEAVAAATETPSGIGPMIADEHEVDPEAFVAFVDALTRQYLSSSHAVLRSLLEGFLTTTLVLAQRSDRDLPALRMTIVLDPRTYPWASADSARSAVSNACLSSPMITPRPCHVEPAIRSQAYQAMADSDAE